MQIYIAPPKYFGLVAQLDRASDYGSEGLGFNSLRDHFTQTFLLKIYFTQRAIAQSGLEHHTDNVGVRGSNPLGATYNCSHSSTG